MADLTSANVTLTKIRRHIVGLVHEVLYQVAYGNGLLTIPAGGVPLPALASFGGLSAVEWFELQPVTIDGYVYKYDLANHKIRKYQSAGFTVLGNVAAPVFTGAAASFGAALKRWSLQNVKGADADVADSATVDQAALPTNSAAIDAAAAVAAGAWTYTENAEIDVPRNVNIVLLNDTGGDIVMEEGDLAFAVTGTFRGQAQTDTITYTFTAGNKTIGHTPNYRWKYGVKPFDHITGVVATGLTATQNGLKISVGLGRLLGVPFEPKDNLVGDFVKVTKNSANLAPVAYDDTNKTLDLGALSDNDDLDIEVEVASLGESYTPAGTNSAPAFTAAAVAAAGLVEVTAAAQSAVVLLLKLQGN